MRLFKSSKRIFFFIFYPLVLLLVIEVSSRLFWYVRKRVPFFDTKKIIYAFYPELKIVDQQTIGKDDGYFDILILDCSVLHPAFGNIQDILSNGLTQRIKEKVRIFNLSMAAHTTWDSYYKYNYLKNKRFDLVICYHGINEVRANNCPPTLFKSDYSHYSWYMLINALERHKEVKYIISPYTLYFIFIKLGDRMGLLKQVPMHAPRKEWMDYGNTIKTSGSFRKNLIDILDIARIRNEKILLLSFAFYVPENYSLGKFKARLLSYRAYRCAIEMWGKPENVITGLRLHNEIIKDVAREYSDSVIFLDMNNAIPKEGRYFDDICHLSPEGCREFAENVIDAIINQVLK